MSRINYLYLKIMKYIKKFSSHTDYAQAELNSPNVSYCVEQNEVHYKESTTKIAKKFQLL